MPPAIVARLLESAAIGAAAAGEQSWRRVSLHSRCLGADPIRLFGREKCSQVFRENERYSGSKPGKLAHYERTRETDTERQTERETQVGD